MHHFTTLKSSKAQAKLWLKFAEPRGISRVFLKLSNWPLGRFNTWFFISSRCFMSSGSPPGAICIGSRTCRCLRLCGVRGVHVRGCSALDFCNAFYQCSSIFSISFAHHPQFLSFKMLKPMMWHLRERVRLLNFILPMRDFLTSFSLRGLKKAVLASFRAYIQCVREAIQRNWREQNLS